jgi:hypothetical protein
MASKEPFKGWAPRLMGIITALHTVASGEVQGRGIDDRPVLVLSRGENSYFIGEKAAGIKILFC